MPDTQNRPPQPWENGWTPDTSRAPGTRRLYLAGALAVATIIACIGAIAWTDKGPDTLSAPGLEDTTSPGGLIGFATPTATETPPPKGKTGLTTAEATSSAPRQQGSSPTPAAEPPAKSPSSKPSSSAPKPAATWRSIRAVNYPDRYWHVTEYYVGLDAVRGSESREDSTFKQVKGLADASCYSFATHDGKYLRHSNFVLRAARNDGSTLFKQDATFCPRASSNSSGAVMLESVNYPGYFLRHRDFVVRLERFEYSSQYLADSSFRLVGGLA
ncbi:AbfB domain-containing protein [Streptomyces sp. RG80]|uniref:AbfB domain-containing protein n=1 Tax=Streptomyces sp. RG80 TaxID=3157340 RepID=UPI00338DDE8B